MTRFHPDQPYNQLPLLPPDAEIESKVILKKCVTARAALAGLKQAGGLIPNQAVLINTIPLLEARDSSEIENIVTTTFCWGRRFIEIYGLSGSTQPRTSMKPTF